MANYQFSGDLIDDVLFRAGEPTDGTSDFNAAALQYVNRAYQALWLGGTEIDPEVNETWWWLYTEGSLLLDVRIITGTVSVTNGSTAATLSASQALSVKDYWFGVTGDVEDQFKVTAHTASTTGLTLDAEFTGVTDGAASYVLKRTDYSLATDVLRLATPMRTFTTNASGSAYSPPGRNFQILGVSNRELDEVAPISQMSQGVPTVFAQIKEEQVRFDKDISGTSKIKVDYTYLKRPADLTDSASEEPVVPRQYRRLIADIAAFFLFLDKDDNRAAPTLQVARAGVRAMALENKVRLRAYADKAKILAPAPILDLGSGLSKSEEVEAVRSRRSV